MELDKSKLWIWHLRPGSPGSTYRQGDEGWRAALQRGIQGLWLTASFIWVSNVPWQPKGPTVLWGASGPALPLGGGGIVSLCYKRFLSLNDLN